jgi:ubiquinone/menaquinone biosynthesis C-methylase UbiE
LDAASVDAVWMLRSFNHLRDPALALAEAARVLRPGGMLLVVDNVAFGLLRTPSQLAQARAIPLRATPFEHLRNASAHDALAVLADLSGAPFEVVEVREVTPATANQWLVRATRTLAPCLHS